MTIHSLILHPHEVRAALAGTLGLVVRPVSRDFANAMDTPRGPEDVAAGYPMVEDAYGDAHKAVNLCPLGVPGDRLCCKEGWADVNTESGPAVTYRADNGLHFCQDDAFPIEYDRYPGMKFTMWCGDLWRGEPGHSWRSPATMPAWASRITLEVVGVRCIRPADLSYADALKCGFSDGVPGALVELERFWTAKYGRRYPWETSWAWAVGVRRVEA